MSYKRKRIIQREKNKEIKEQRKKDVTDAKAAVKKVRDEGRAKVKGVDVEWANFARSLKERTKARAAGPPAAGVNQVGGASGSGLSR
jgi:thiamine pyrophosphokinase